MASPSVYSGNIQLKIRNTQLFENIPISLSYKFCSVIFSYSALFFLSI